MSAPPTKRTISTTSPSARVVALYWALGTMSPFRSTATRAGSYPPGSGRPQGSARRRGWAAVDGYHGVKHLLHQKWDVTQSGNVPLRLCACFPSVGITQIRLHGSRVVPSSQPVTQAPPTIYLYTPILYTHCLTNTSLAGGNFGGRWSLLGPAQVSPCNVVSRPVPGGIQAFSRESPDAKKSRGVTPPPPSLRPARWHSLVLAWWGAAGGGRGLCPGGPSPDGGRQLEPGNPEQSEEQGTVAQYSEALERAADLGLSRQEIIQVCQDIIADRGAGNGRRKSPGAARRKCRCDWGRLAILRRSRPGPFQATPATRIRLITRTVPLCRSGPAPVKATPATQRCPLRTGYRKTKRTVNNNVL